MLYFTVGLCVCMQWTGVFTATLPQQKCKLTDSVCLRAATQELIPKFTDGFKDLEVEPLDVLHVDSIRFDLAGLKMSMKDVDIRGLQKAIVEKIVVDTAKKQILFTYNTNIDLRSKYKAGGRLLILPINGDGDFNLKLKKLTIDLTMPYEIQEKDGKKVMELTSFTYKHKIKDGAHFELNNLFNGNKQLSDGLLTFMNQNWQLIVQEFGSPILEKPMKKTFGAIKNYLKSQSLDDLLESK